MRKRSISSPEPPSGWPGCRPRLIWLLFACCVIGAIVPLGLGLTYSDRLGDHGGYFLVKVDDRLPPAHPPPPRRTVLVVFDGLGYKEALTMRSLQGLRARGQCRKTDVGSLSLSRPVYAVISTGLEQDRTGVRGNDGSAPLAAESIWDVAREAALPVAAFSELPWWRELFPRGFSRYTQPPRAANYFHEVSASEPLTLVHPVYIDEAGHEWGASSAPYREAVARGDRELAGLIATLDLSQDLLVVTADHGHALHGGHGGFQDRIANVLTCYAGRGVQHRDELGMLRSTSIGPSLVMLMGLRFPRHLRAGDDDLGALFEIADPAGFPAGYLADRAQAVERFRAANRAALREWLPQSEGSWQRFYSWHRMQQLRRGLPFIMLGVAVLLGQAWLHLGAARSARKGRRDILFGWLWMALFGLVSYTLQVRLRGSFDMSSIDERAHFIRFTISLGALWVLAAVGLHFVGRRRFDALAIDLAALVALGAVVSLAHPVMFGWQLGFPVPRPALYFLPYFAALFFTSLSGMGILIGLAIRRLGRDPTPGALEAEL